MGSQGRHEFRMTTPRQNPLDDRDIGTGHFRIGPVIFPNQGFRPRLIRNPKSAIQNA